MTTRRVFLRSSGLALVSFGLAPRLLLRAAEASPRQRRGRVLVVLFQRGACDGLNTVVPHGEKAYYALRPTIAIPRPRGGGSEAALDLDGLFGLHPSLAGLLPLYREGSLALVHAVGSPDPTRSHFDAQDFMESGTPGVKSTRDGWMNRGMGALPEPGATPFRAVALSPRLPRILDGRAPAVAMESVDRFGLRGGPSGAVARDFEAMYGGASGRLHGTGREAFEAVQLLRAADPERYRPAAGVRYPRGRYGESLRQIAQLLKADLGVEMAFADGGGWDHHAAEGGVTGQLATRLDELGRALAAFHRDLGDRMDDVLVVTLTEFGRTARENGNRGTDHGHASVSFVLGGTVRGGRVYGRWPGLAEADLHEGRDLALTTDFRDLVAEILVRHLGVTDLGAVFPGRASDPARFPGVVRA